MREFGSWPPPFTCFSFHITVTLCSASFVLCGTCSEELKVEIKGLYVLFFAAVFIRKEIQSVKMSELFRAIGKWKLQSCMIGTVLWTSPRQHDFFSVFLRCMFPRSRSADKLIHVKQAVCCGIQFRMGHIFTNRHVFRSAAENSEIRRINYGRFCI